MKTAIKMDKGDHRVYATTGNLASAKKFRAEEAALLKQGKYMEAFEKNVDEIRRVHGSKYDQHISQARDHFIKEVLPQLKKQAGN